jgi:hypothetical protein
VVGGTGGIFSAGVAKASAGIFSKGTAGPAAVALCLLVPSSAGAAAAAGAGVSVFRMIGKPSLPLPIITTFEFVDCES